MDLYSNVSVACLNSLEMPRRLKLCHRKDRARQECQRRDQVCRLYTGGYGFIRRCALYWNNNAIQAKASDNTSSIPATDHEEVMTATNSISSLRQSLASCDHGWVDVSSQTSSSICLCKFSTASSPSSQPPIITLCVPI